MKTVLMVGLGLLVWSSMPAAAKDSPDDFLAEMKKCGVCNAMSQNPELMEHMVWETHKIDNGMLCVASVDKEHVKEFMEVHKHMMKNVEKVKADAKLGKKTELCGFCQGMGELDKAGAKHQVIQTATGVVTLCTSTDPQVVKRIHAHADKAIEMQKAMHPHLTSK